MGLTLPAPIWFSLAVNFLTLIYFGLLFFVPFVTLSSLPGSVLPGAVPSKWDPPTPGYTRAPQPSYNPHVPRGSIFPTMALRDKILALIGSIATRYTRASLFVTRQSLYGASLFTAIIAVLLPISLVTYLNFYKMLVPVERFAVPTLFLKSSSGLASSDIDPLKALSFLRRNADLPFSVRINLRAVCFVEKSYHLIEYLFSLTPQVTRENSFIINCDLRYIYVDRNSWIPYHLRYWVPPIFVDIFKTVEVDWPLLYSTGRELAQLLHEQKSHILFRNTDPILIDNSKTTLDFVIEWNGIRYYLVNYYFTSLFVGVLIFWGISSFICMISTLYYYNKFSDETEESPQKPPASQKQD